MYCLIQTYVVPGPVVNFTLIATSSDTLQVSWRDPSTINGVLLYFEISYHPSLDVTDDISVNITPNASGSYQIELGNLIAYTCLLYTSPSPRDRQKSRMPSSA